MAVAALGVVTGASAAPGPSQKECLVAAERGQQLRNAGKLMSARAELMVCQSASCPGIVRDDCIKWLGEIQDATPTVIVTVKDGVGSDILDAKVTVDGKPLTTEMLGRAIPLDPGAHVVRATRGDLERETQVLVTQGSKQRLVEVVLESPKEPAAKTDGPVTTPPALPPPAVVTPVRIAPLPPPPMFGTQRYVSVGVAGAGVLSLVVGAAIGAGYNSSVADLREGCGRTASCAQSEVDAIAGEKTAAYVFAGLGGALLVTSAVLFVTGAPQRRERSITSLVPTIAPVAGGAFGALGGSF